VSKALSSWLGISLCTLGYFCATSNTALAQVTSDGTVNTQVTENGNTAEITGGETRGDNLFHSFQDFSVPTGNEASFLNANDISNIFSRVTGGNISNIDGLISANGSANLFLINPAGIIFGEGARLDIGGSFYGSSASSILFEDGEFSATDLDNPPLLTINAPIGLGFRDEPGDIVNQSFVQNSAEETVGLEVLPGNNLAFVGGNIKLDRGNLTASGGNIELGGLTEAGIVSINPDGSLSFPDDVTKADITLSNGADVDVTGTGGGSVTVNAGNLNLTAGEFGSSFIRAGIRPESTSAEAQAGDVTINVTDKITLDNSNIGNQFAPGGAGNLGNINIFTGSLEAINGGQVSTDTFGQGNAGSINITATGDITFDGQNSGGIPSRAISQVNPDAVGDAGDVSISTNNLTLTNGGTVSASTFGQGNAGSVDITATGDLTFDGENSGGIPSGATSQVNSGAEGDAGGVTISTNNLTLTNGGRVDASTLGQGNAGSVDITATGDLTFDGETLAGIASSAASQVTLGAEGNAGGVTITTNNLTLTNGGSVDASTLGQGNAGSVNITATGDLSFDGENSQGFGSGATSLVTLGAVGNAGGVTISTNNLNLTNGGRVSASTFGQGNAGLVDITATGDLTFDGETLAGFPSGIESQVNPYAEGDAGGVTITTNNLNLTNGGRIDASTFGQGDAGLVDITATGDLTFDGEDSDGFQSGAISNVVSDAEANSGGVTITTNNLNLTNGGRVSASTFGQGDAGLVDITATGDLTFDGEDSGGFASGAISVVEADAEGNSGGVTIKTSNLNLTKGGRVNASTFGVGDAGEVNITATDDITFDGETLADFPSGAISAVAPDAEGDAGGVTIKTSNLNLTNGGRIDASTGGQGDAGAVKITATGDLTFDGETSGGFSSGATSEVNTGAVGNAGGVTIKTSNLNLTNGGLVSTSTGGQGNAGNVTIDASESIFISSSTKSSRSGIYTDAVIEDGNGGDINISANQLTIANGGTIEATNFDRLEEFSPGTGQPGNIFIEANNIDLADQARIDAATQFPTGESGEIDLQVAEDITLQGNSFISAQAFNNADGGNLNIDARFIVAFPNNGTGNDLVATAEQGIGGNINLNAEQIFGLEPGNAINGEGDLIDNSNNDIDASSNVFGFDGTINIDTSDINPVQGATELPSNVVEPEQTTAQTCSAGRGTANNGLAIAGKGGVPPAPDTPLNSENIISSEQNPAAFAIPQPIETSQGKIQPARGIKVSKSGKISLTAYRTNNAGERIPEIQPNCN
jgi:filamentous hemagglutinin family protein